MGNLHLQLETSGSATAETLAPKNLQAYLNYMGVSDPVDFCPENTHGSQDAHDVAAYGSMMLHQTLLWIVDCFQRLSKIAIVYQ